ncbi:MAG: collagen-like protein [Defluviitaleaceae bacterium]|nr:collagen-like protein [Defluviitaleaceae bacterium]
MDKPYSVRLELYDTERRRATELVYVAGDREVYPLRVYLESGGAAFKLAESAVVMLRFKTKDGVFVDLAEAAEREKGLVTYELAASLLTGEGIVECSAEVQDGDEILTWPAAVSFRVLGNGGPGEAMPPEPLMPWANSVDGALGNLEGRVAALEQAEPRDGTGGAQGPAGPQGETGPAGPQGIAGKDGMDGAPGSAGPQGETGSAGPQGIAGKDGMDGAPGPVGPQGVQGNAGKDGAQGYSPRLRAYGSAEECLAGSLDYPDDICFVETAE